MDRGFFLFRLLFLRTHGRVKVRRSSCAWESRTFVWYTERVDGKREGKRKRPRKQARDVYPFAYTRSVIGLSTYVGTSTSLQPLPPFLLLSTFLSFFLLPPPWSRTWRRRSKRRRKRKEGMRFFVFFIGERDKRTPTASRPLIGHLSLSPAPRTKKELKNRNKRESPRAPWLRQVGRAGRVCLLDFPLARTCVSGVYVHLEGG